MGQHAGFACRWAPGVIGCEDTSMIVLHYPSMPVAVVREDLATTWQCRIMRALERDAWRYEAYGDIDAIYCRAGCRAVYWLILDRAARAIAC